MKNSILIPVIAILFLVACESVYIPELDEVESVLVVDARLVANSTSNRINLQWSRGFNEEDGVRPVLNARVILTDEYDKAFLTVPDSFGNYYLQDQLDVHRQYRLNIVLGNEIYRSEFEGIPPLPDFDTIYGEDAEQWVKPGGENNTEDFIRYKGQQLYVDLENENEERFYRFYSRKIHQFYFPFDTTMLGMPSTEYKYGWKSYYPQGIYNLAGPAEYTSSKGIVKHPVEFFVYNERSYLDSTQRGMGWIYIMHQYGLSESAYRFYQDLNNQLDAEGKIFDPLYIQARNNLHCITDSQKIVLGNFEIASYREHRFYVKLSSNSDYHILRRIEVFHDIPMKGIQPLSFPWFWEH